MVSNLRHHTSYVAIVLRLRISLHALDRYISSIGAIANTRTSRITNNTANIDARSITTERDCARILTTIDYNIAVSLRNGRRCDTSNGNIELLVCRCDMALSSDGSSVATIVNRVAILTNQTADVDMLFGVSTLVSDATTILATVDGTLIDIDNKSRRDRLFRNNIH